jgi:predicted nuclease of predicted toxin-antitoxin system
MRLYLDDDSASALLVRLLQRDGHDVETPTGAGLIGAYDPVHLTHAIASGRCLLSQNHDDFARLHELVIQAGGHHPGVLIVRKDNDPSRDMKPAHIVRAIANLLAASVALADQFVILNHWR